MRALNSSAVFEETTEEGRLFQKGIVLGKKEFFRASLYRPYILCIVNHEIPWYFLSWVLGSDIYLYQETLYRSESCKRKLRRTSPCRPPGMATQVRPTYRQHYSKLHKRPYKARFIANSSSCTTTELFKLLTSCLTAIKSHVIRYCETVYETSNKNWFWSIKNSGEVLNKLKCRGFTQSVSPCF